MGIKITDIQHDGLMWSITINDKYLGEWPLLIIAANIAFWKFIIGSLRRKKV